MATLADRVFRAKLQMELEPTDFILKRFLQANPSAYLKPQDLFVYLRTLTDRYWTEMSQAVPLIYEWAQYLRVPDNINDLKYQIWENFLCRLSLDARLITGRAPSESQGNEVLRILIETVETTLLSRLSVHQLIQEPQLQQQQQHTVSSRMALPPPPTQSSPLVDVPPLPSSLQAFYAQQQQQQQQQDLENKEMAALQRSMHQMVLPPQTQGMPIKLRRTKEDIDYYPPRSQTRKKKSTRPERPSNKGSRSRKQLSLSRSTRKYDEDEDDEDEDDKDAGEGDEDEDDDDPDPE